MAASNILKIEAVIAAKEGQSESYVGMLKEMADGYISEILYHDGFQYAD